MARGDSGKKAHDGLSNTLVFPKWEHCTDVAFLFLNSVPL
jgi:hypothetical protein